MPELRTIKNDRPGNTGRFRILSPRWWWREFLPFHTILAVSLAVLVRASKLAAALGVWVGNPLSIPFFYYGSYRIGQLVLGLPGLRFPEDHSLLVMAKLGGEIVGAMVLGGVILGIIPAVVAYVLTLKLTSSPRFSGAFGERQR
jgi:uncharacterized protein (DUF2062 family)